MKTIYYGTQLRRHRRYAVRHIMNALYEIYEAEYSHYENMMCENPMGDECYSAGYSSEILLDVIGMLYGAYH